MRINYNMSAAIANKQLLGIENNLSKTMERLSSGLKINHSKDNPAGMAISNKMQAQIDGLNRASRNSSDGISVIEIADGALNEVTNILQRMRELSVQAANSATMSLEDKQAVQSEIDALKQEVNRISKDTEYNSKPLLDGSLDTRVYPTSDAGASGVTRIQTTDAVKEGKYSLVVNKAATAAGPIGTAGVDYQDDAKIGASGVLKINGVAVKIESADTHAEVFEKIRNAAEVGETEVTLDDAGNISFQSAAVGGDSVIDLAVSDKSLSDALGIQLAAGPNSEGTPIWDFDPKEGVYVYKEEMADPDDATKTIKAIPRGKNAEVELTVPTDGTGFSNTATAAYDGNRVTVTDVRGFSLSFLLKDGYAKDAVDKNDPTVTYDGKIEFEVTDKGRMTLHVGANQSQNMEVRIAEVSVESLYIDDLDVTTVGGADRAMTKLDAAIAQVSEVRSSLGAYENRLDYTVKSLDSFEENMTSAISRLTDADMADEMTDYTHLNVLNQAAISVLTQANDIPQQILQILQ